MGKSRQNGEICMLLFLVRFKKRCGGISEVGFLELPGRRYQWKTAYVKRSRRDFWLIFFATVSSVHRTMPGTKQVPEWRRWGNSFASAYPQLCALYRYWCLWSEQSEPWILDISLLTFWNQQRWLGAAFLLVRKMFNKVPSECGKSALEIYNHHVS